MKQIGLSLVILCIAGSCTLAQQKRQLLLFADQAGSTQLQQQQRILQADEPGLKERDLDVRTYLASQSPQIFKRYRIKTGFTFVLIGKDGGEKLRSNAPVSLRKLFGTIDAMPMRLDEMKHHP